MLSMPAACVFLSRSLSLFLRCHSGATFFFRFFFAVLVCRWLAVVDCCGCARVSVSTPRATLSTCMLLLPARGSASSGRWLGGWWMTLSPDASVIRSSLSPIHPGILTRKGLPLFARPAPGHSIKVNCNLCTAFLSLHPFFLVFFFFLCCMPWLCCSLLALLFSAASSSPTQFLEAFAAVLVLFCRRHGVSEVKQGLCSS